jgi:hypothetical protein
MASDARDNERMVDIADVHRLATGAPVAKTLPCDGDYIVLLDYYDASQARLWANLRRLRPDGQVVWAAQPPSSGDVFTGVDWREGRLVAWTWECFMITVDPASGRLIEKVFTK